MQGVILAGGQGTRLLPLTRSINKHLLPIGKIPMIVHPLNQLLSAGIKDIMIISSRDQLGDIIKYLGSGDELGDGCRLTYRPQEKPDGIAGALSLAQDFVKHKCCVMLGDNIFIDSISDHIRDFEYSPKHCRLILKRLDSVDGLGVVKWKPRLDSFSQTMLDIEDIVEKSSNPPSNDAVLGCYCYNVSVFGYIKKIHPSARGELEITDLNRLYLKNNLLEHRIITGGWIDTGTLEDYLKANEILRSAKN
jgi:glucose-1-phosphate thymidylyltransferase